MILRRRAFFGTAPATVLAVALLAAGCSSDPDPAPASSSPAAESASRPPASTGAPVSTSRPTPTRPSTAQVVAGIRAQFDKIADGEPNNAVSAAVTDLDGKTVYSFGEKNGMRTASVYKLLVLETLLRQSDGPLSGSRAERATRMIENSDNEAAYSLYLDAGGCSPLKKTVSLLKMRHTDVGCEDPTFTRTSGADMILALRAVTGSGLLTSSARKYARGLMSNVAKDQRWGVGAVANPKGDFYNKNGWLGFDDDSGRWAVNSVGVVRVGNRTLLMAVFTQHQPDYDGGIELNEKLARLVAPAALA